MELWKDGRKLKGGYVDNMNGFGFLWVAGSEAKEGKYEMRVNNLRFEKDAVKDFVVNVYSSQKVAIVDSLGNTSDASKVQVFQDGTTMQLLP